MITAIQQHMQNVIGADVEITIINGNEFSVYATSEAAINHAHAMIAQVPGVTAGETVADDCGYCTFYRYA